QLAVLLWVLGPLSRGVEPAAFRGAMRLLGLLRPWCMVPVFLLGVLVAVVKLAGMAAVSPGIGLFAFGVLTIFLTMLGRLTPHVLWRYAESEGVVPVHVPEAGPDVVLTGCHVCGQVQAVPRDADPEEEHHCVRCHAVVHYRKPDHLNRTWALLLAAVVFYIPANVLPVMKVSSVLGDSAHTILGGVVELWDMGSWDIALIVFIASVAVPLTKLLALILLLLTEQWRSTTNLRPRTRLYQMVEFIGQWSMLDVFVVILLAALADFQGLMEISAGAGAAAFGVVVILTMLSAMSFDLRRSWDLEAVSELDATEPAAGRRPASAGVEAG
ncbi:paraquat-inducible protein A, partial [Achromobacter xylosoxidans]